MSEERKSVEWKSYVWAETRVATMAAVDAAEHELKVRFPDDFRTFVIEHGGDSPEPSAFSLRQKGKKTDSSFSVLYHVVTDEGDGRPADYGLVQVNRDAKDNLPAGVVAFGEDAGGSYLAFDFRETMQMPPVVFVDHERIGEEGWVSPVSTTFTDLVNSLHEG